MLRGGAKIAKKGFNGLTGRIEFDTLLTSAHCRNLKHGGGNTKKCGKDK